MVFVFRDQDEAEGPTQQAIEERWGEVLQGRWATIPNRPFEDVTDYFDFQYRYLPHRVYRRADFEAGLASLKRSLSDGGTLDACDC